MKIISPENVATPRGPYVHGRLIDPGKTWLSISGQVGIKADDTIAEGIADQTHAVWANILEVLRDGGMDIGDIVKVTSFLVSADLIPEFGRVRAEYLGDFKPTSTLLIVAGLASPELLVEVEVLAAK